MVPSLTSSIIPGSWFRADRAMRSLYHTAVDAGTRLKREGCAFLSSAKQEGRRFLPIKSVAPRFSEQSRFRGGWILFATRDFEISGGPGGVSPAAPRRRRRVGMTADSARLTARATVATKPIFGPFRYRINVLRDTKQSQSGFGGIRFSSAREAPVAPWV